MREEQQFHAYPTPPEPDGHISRWALAGRGRITDGLHEETAKIFEKWLNEAYEEGRAEMNGAIQKVAQALFLHRFKGPEENPDELEAKIAAALEEVGVKQ